jgi:chromosome segregation ATPase
MSEERTRDLPNNRSFEERLFSRLDAMDSRFELMDSRFDAMGTRFDAMETRFDAMETRFDRRFDGLDTRLQALEAKALDTKPIWENALAEIVAVKENVQEVKGRVENIERKFELLIIDMMQLRGDQRRVDKRMDALEFSPQ